MREAAAFPAEGAAPAVPMAVGQAVVAVEPVAALVGVDQSGAAAVEQVDAAVAAVMDDGPDVPGRRRWHWQPARASRPG